MICYCGKPVEPARVEFGLTKCLSCAKNIPYRPLKARMVYLDKCTSMIEIHTADSWNENKKYFTPNGARSVVKNFSKNISG